jgi:cysteinyl-tRNA synthetase
MLQTHYRKTMEISPAAMAQTEAGLERLDALARRANRAGLATDAAGDPNALDADAVATFVAAMDDDLGTAKAVAVIFDTASKANAALDANDTAAAAMYVATVVDLAGALGLTLNAETESETDPEVDALVAKRTEARAAKDWATADAVRDELVALGIEVEDTPDGPIWRRV